jgi:hypothetical protein
VLREAWTGETRSKICERQDFGNGGTAKFHRASDVGHFGIQQLARWSMKEATTLANKFRPFIPSVMFLTFNV